MPRKRTNELIASAHFAWKLHKRNGVWHADGRSNSVNAGRHSLGTDDRAEAIQRLSRLDTIVAADHGLIPRDQVSHETAGPLQLAEGRKLYENHIKRPRIAGGVAASTQKRYRTVFDKFILFAESIGIKTWNAVTSQTINAYATYLDRKNYAGKSLKTELVVLIQVQKWLINEKHLVGVERLKIKIGKVEGQRAYCYTPTQVEAMVQHCKSKQTLGWLANVLVALSCTGLRIAELCSLRWSDIDQLNGRLNLTDESGRARQAGKKRRELKSGRSRQLPIHTELSNVLADLPHVDAYVLHGARGGRLKPDTVRSILVREVIKPLQTRFPSADDEHGFKNGRLHSFRHYFASLCAIRGVPERVVMDWLGHKDSSMVRHYYHLHDAESRQQMDRLNPLNAAGTRPAGITNRAEETKPTETTTDPGEPYNVVLRLRTKGCDWRWFRFRGDTIRGVDGKAQRMAGSMADVTDAVLAEQELTRKSRLDKLTGLPNRELFLDRLQHTILRARRAQTNRYAVMFLDFDRFKIVNDTLGHDVGDALLKEIAKRLQENVRSVDSVSRRVTGNSTGRLGGDEFVVLLDEMQQPDEAFVVADRLMTAFARPYQLGVHEVYSTASIGIVTGDTDYERAEDVLCDADMAMYEAKRAGKARYVVFDASMRQRLQRRLQLENDLRKAIHSNQLSLVFQPMVSLSTGETTLVEALLRWEHPKEGEINTAELISIAEESELIQSLGDWTLSAGCRQMADWIEVLGAAAPTAISINLSPKQFTRRGFALELQRLLDDTGLHPSRLQLEVKEDAFVKDFASAIETMRTMRGLGVRLAIDNFGTGIASFASLHRLPINMLKVDRSLMVGLEDSKDTASLIHALAVLVKNLGISLVAEGIETPSQVMALQELGCEYGQGYFFARPLTSAALVDFVSRQVAFDHESSGASAFANRLPECIVLETT